MMIKFYCHYLIYKYHAIKILINFEHLNCTISFEIYLVLMRIWNLKANINNKVGAIAHVIATDPVNRSSPPVFLGKRCSENRQQILSRAYS